MAKRPVIMIDEEKCNGCGACLPGCPEGALQVVDGKARLVKESHCDGLGACLGYCPRDALRVVQREAEPYDAGAIPAREREQPAEPAAGSLSSTPPAACPSGQALQWLPGESGGNGRGTGWSELGHWPVKLRLLPLNADFLKNADLVLMADCVPFAYGNLHNDFLKDRVVAAGCPKFDDGQAYVEKLGIILESTNLKSITVVYMEVPCCSGFIRIVGKALEQSAAAVPLRAIQIGIRGSVIKHT